VKLSDVEPFSGILAAPNALMMTGADITVMLALEVLPVPPFVEVTCTLLFFTPAVVPIMSSERAQDVFGARLTLVKLTEPEPLTAVPVPPQVVLRFDDTATTKPAGRLSANAIPFRVETALLLLIVNVRLVTPFSGIVDAPNALTIVGGMIAVRLAEAVFPLPASAELIVTLLLKTPSAVPRTFTATEQIPAARAAFVKLIVPLPPTAVTVPPQLLTTLGVASTTELAGRVSVKFA
jgi:hypothetical protein